MNPWHLDEDLLRRYAAGSTDLPLVGSVEAHFIACATCRRLADGVAPPERLARVWQNIEASIDAPRPTILRRILARLGLANPVTTLPRPSPRILGAVASAVLFLVATVWAAKSSTINDSTPVLREPASAASASSPASGSSASPGPMENLVSRLDVPIAAADLPVLARSLATWTQSAATTVDLKPCLLAATDQRATPLAVAIRLYQHEQAGNVLSAIVVFRSSRARNLDVYVVEVGCAGEKGRLLDAEKYIPYTLRNWVI
jgi:hypothetical protein